MGAHPLVALDAGNPCELQHPQHQQLLILGQGILGRSFHPMRHPMRLVRQHHHRLAMVPALVPSHLMMMRLLRSLHNGLSGSWLPRRIGERLSERGDDPSRESMGASIRLPLPQVGSGALPRRAVGKGDVAVFDVDLVLLRYAAPISETLVAPSYLSSRPGPHC